MKKANYANILPSSRFWSKVVTKIAKKQKEENPKNPFLSHEEKSELFLDWKKNGNIKSRDKLLNSMYLMAFQLVHQLVNVYGNNNIPIEDLEQEANHALLDMLCNSDYDPELGTLPTYFRTRIKMFFHPALKNGNLITFPDNTWKQFNAESRAFNEFVKKHHRYPVAGETYTHKGKEYLFGEVSVKMPSISEGNRTVGDEDDSCELFDLLGQQDESIEVNEFEEQKSALYDVINKLSRREQELIHYSFYTEMDTQDIVYNLKPLSPTERKRLYERSKNNLVIKTSEGEQNYQFFVYNNAKKRSSGDIDRAIIRPVTHPNFENFQNNSNLVMVFGAKDVESVTLNGKDITDKISVLQNKTFESLNTGDTLFQLSCELKVGTIFSQSNYNAKLKALKDKLRTKIKNYEIFRTA